MMREFKDGWRVTDGEGYSCKWTTFEMAVDEAFKLDGDIEIIRKGVLLNGDAIDVTIERAKYYIIYGKDKLLFGDFKQALLAARSLSLVTKTKSITVRRN